MKIKEGDYLRFENGEIIVCESRIVPKIVKAEDELYAVNFFNKCQKIKKMDESIIKLIEIGDIVNGHKVVDIAYEPVVAIYLEDISQKGALIPVYEKDIKTILSKQQLDYWSFKVGEKNEVLY